MTTEIQETMLTGQDNTDTGAGTAAEVESTEPTEQQATEASGEQSQEAESGNQGAPEAYADFVVPEGLTIDAEVMDEFLPTAKELGLNQENAQKLVDMASKLTEKMQQQQATQWQEQITGWAEQTRNDKELGGANLPQTLGVARQALQQFASPELNQLLKDSGIGNHPEMVRFAYKIGKAISDDQIITGNLSSGAARTTDQVLYPTMNQK